MKIGDKVYVPSTVEPGNAKVLGHIVDIISGQHINCPYQVETTEGRSYYPLDEVDPAEVIYSHPLEE